MKKSKVFFLVVMIGVFFSCKKLFNKPCSSPQRPSNLPDKAIWGGDCDGGYWIEMLGVEDEVYRFKIYRDWDAKLVMDCNFKFNEIGFKLTSQNWSKVVCCYSTSKEPNISLVVVDRDSPEKKSYELISIYPAFGGEDWYLIKEKYNLQ